MKASKIGKLTLTKELFIQSMNALEKQREIDDKCSNAFSTLLPNDYTSNYDNHLLYEQLIHLLKVAMNDDSKDSWIEYYCWELDFGSEYKDGMITDKDKKSIPLRNSEDLYNCLVEHGNA